MGIIELLIYVCIQVYYYQANISRIHGIALLLYLAIFIWIIVVYSSLKSDWYRICGYMMRDKNYQKLRITNIQDDYNIVDTMFLKIGTIAIITVIDEHSKMYKIRVKITKAKWLNLYDNLMEDIPLDKVQYRGIRRALKKSIKAQSIQDNDVDHEDK